MIISFVILTVYIIYTALHPRKGILAFFPVSLLFTTVPLFSFGNTHIGLNLCMMLFAICTMTKKRKDRLSIRSNPFYLNILAFVIGFVLIFILGAYRSSLYPFIVLILNYLFVILLWPYFKFKSDILFFIKCLIVVFFIICLYAIIEFILGYNVWMEWLQSQTTASIFSSHHDDYRLGFARMNSVFHFPIPLGDACALMISFLLFWELNSNFKLLKGMRLIVFIGLLIVGLVLSNSRAPIIALFLGLLHLNIFKNKKRLFIFIIAGFSLSVLGYSYISSVIGSMLDESSDNVGGSSVNLRELQLAYCINEFLKNPIFGAGFNRLMELQDPTNRELAGAESHAFFLLVEQGICGIVTYIYACLKMFTLFKGFSFKMVIFTISFTLLWIAADMISLTTGINITFPIIILMLVYRSCQLDMINNSLKPSNIRI